MMKNKYRAIVLKHGADLLISDKLLLECSFIQHGNTTVLEHSFNVACISLLIAYVLHIKIKERETVRGALLHDYFLYDWHCKRKNSRLHGFTHARTALYNADRDFTINNIERNIIIRHMFPLNLTPPKYRESLIVCIADKIGAIAETLHINKLIFKL